MKPLKVIVTTILLMVISIHTSAQKNDTLVKYHRSYYVIINVGYAGFGSASSSGIVAQVSKGSVLAFSNQKTIKNVPSSGFKLVPKEFSEAWSLSYGKIFKQKWGHFTIMTGPSFVKVTNRIDAFSNESETNTSAGLAIGASVVPAYKWIGGGINQSIYQH